MKIHRNTIWLIPLAFLVTFPLWSIPVGDFLTPRGGFDPDINKESADHHNFTMQTVTILQNQKGKDTAVIRAANARTKPDDLNIVILDQVVAEIFDDNGNVTHITSKSGEYNLTYRALTLIKDVVLNKTQDNHFMYTDLLIYNSQQHTVVSPGKTKIKSENAEIIGGSLDYNIISQTYVIDKRVKCLINGFIEP
ncbi:MAG: LPS export ABC transporter periplasmic protein LptC [Proteobacteria bacterium]|nr:LPS export ABC transporter periplasmic protein LptC [Pseudomonadota bacterium]